MRSGTSAYTTLSYRSCCSQITLTLKSDDYKASILEHVGLRKIWQHLES